VRTAIALFLVLVPRLTMAATVQVDITPGHSVNTFVPIRALGAGVDGEPGGAVDQIYTPPNLAQMRSAGWGAVSYRLFTELGVQTWHWNPTGSWSDPANSRGYFTGGAIGGSGITHSFGYRLPHRGFTHDQAYDDDFSRLTDGDLTTYWKSNPYLTAAFTGEPDAQHPQWVLVDLGSPRAIDAIQLVWAEPHASSYRVEYWTGSDALFDQGNGQWQLMLCEGLHRFLQGSDGTGYSRYEAPPVVPHTARAADPAPVHRACGGERPS
jgi:hypothetical protein